MNILPHNPLEDNRLELTIPLHDGTEEKTAIVVVHNNNLDYLNLCLQSITIASVNHNYELIVVDNGSGKETQDYLDQIEKDGVIVIRNNKNLLWSAAANKGAAAASKDCKYIIFMHYDVVVLNPGWIDLLADVSESQESGMVGLGLGKYKIQNQDVDYVQEWCVLFTKKSWEALGPWPETLPLIGHSFVMTMKASIHGHRPQAIKNPVCHHYGVFNVDYNIFEQETDKAMAEIPRLLRGMQSVSVAV